MSYHYDFALACDLKADTPQQVIDTLAYMARKADYPYNNPPAHSFFDEGWHWRYMLQMLPEETYSPGNVGSCFRRAYRAEGVYRYTLGFRCWMLDDTFYWASFTDWLAPHSETEGCVGYYREEHDWQPTLIYFKSGEVF